jgi:hypothetical protein
MTLIYNVVAITLCAIFYICPHFEWLQTIKWPSVYQQVVQKALFIL